MNYIARFFSLRDTKILFDGKKNYGEAQLTFDISDLRNPVLLLFKPTNTFITTHDAVYRSVLYFVCIYLSQVLTAQICDIQVGFNIIHWSFML